MNQAQRESGIEQRLTTILRAALACPLRAKVGFLLLVGSVLPVLLFGTLFLNREREAARAANLALLEARADEIGHTLEAMYHGYQAAAQRAARDPDFIRFFASPTAPTRDLGLLREHLRVFSGSDPGIRGAAVVDRSGRILSATEPQLVGIDVSYRAHFQLALAGSDAISDLFVSFVDRVPSVAFSSPVRSAQGEVVGVYILYLRAQALWDVMRAGNDTAGRGSSFALFDRYGIRIGDSAHEELLFHPSSPVPDASARAMIADRRFQERTACLLTEVVPFPLHEFQANDRRRFRLRASPRDSRIHLAVAESFPTLGGALVASAPESEIEVGLSGVAARVLPALLVGLALSFVGSALMMRHVVGPIRRVAAAAAALERGEFAAGKGSGVAADVGSMDEVGGLARAFDSMAAALADRERILRDRNRELERHHRALMMLSKCNEALVRASDERTLLNDACDIIVRVGGYRMCWAGFAEHDERKSIVPVARSGHDDGYLSSVDLVWDDVERGRGPSGLAIRMATPVLSRSIASDPRFATWRGEAVKRGYRSMAAVPILAAGDPLGILAIYAEEEDAFDDSELALLRDLAGDLAYGIGALRGRAERELMSARLLEADRMVAVGTLAAGVAHEINNPLSYVVAAHQFLTEELQFLEREVPASRLGEMKQALAEATEGGLRVKAIVRDVKTFSRADEEQTRPVELHPVLESSISMVFNEIRHRARLVKEFAPVPHVLANDARLGQVFLNLLVNAAQAIPEGAAERNEIRLTTRTDGSGRAIVEVRDTGIGIPPDVARRIFDPFFTTKPVGVGTGLGLFVCRNVLTALGGEIAVESEPGSGTVFRVTLPAAQSGADVARPRVRRAGGLQVRGRILVVDDEPTVGSAVRRLLRDEHDVTALTSAREACTRIGRGERFHVILCDLMMPNMTGMELHAELAVVAPDQASRMVLLTGGAFTVNAREFVDRWANPQVEKPIDADELREIVRVFVASAVTTGQQPSAA